MLLLDLTPDRAASEGHTSHPDNGNIRIELKFSKPLPYANTCFLYLEFDNSVRIDNSRTVSTDFFLMDTVQIECILQNVKSFIGVFPSDFLPHSISRSGSFIINADPLTERGSHWLAIHFEPRSSSAYYFDSYGIFLIIPTMQAFLKRNCTVWDYKATRLQVLMSTVCGQYCCLFAL